MRARRVGAEPVHVGRAAVTTPWHCQRWGSGIAARTECADMQIIILPIYESLCLSICESIYLNRCIYLSMYIYICIYVMYVCVYTYKHMRTQMYVQEPSRVGLQMAQLGQGQRLSQEGQTISFYIGTCSLSGVPVCLWRLSDITCGPRLQNRVCR